MTNLLRRFMLPLLILAGAVAVFAWLKATKPESKPVEHEEKAWPVAAYQIHRIDAAPVLGLYGKLDSLWSSTLTSAVNADVAEIPVIEGNEIALGGLLIRLDDRDARLELAQVQAGLAEAKARLDTQQQRHQSDLASLPRERRLLELAQNEVGRLTGLVKTKAASESSLDAARQTVERQAVNINKLELAIQEHPLRMAELGAQRDRAAALVDVAQLSLERTQVKAPYRAAVAKLHVAPGQRVRSGDKLVDLFDADAMLFRALIPDHYLALVNKARGQGSVLEVSALLDGEMLKATLVSLSSQVAAGSGGVEGLFRLEKTGALQRGRLTRLEFRLPQQQAVIALAHEALYGPDQVYVVDADNRLRLARVERLGEYQDQQGRARVLVRADELADGSLILATQLANAIDGLLVKVVSQDD